MTASKKAKIKKPTSRKKRRRQSLSTVSKAKHLITTFKDVNDLANFARKNIFRFVNQFRKTAMRRGLPWPKE